MHIANGFVIVCHIQIVIQMLYQSFETLLLLSLFIFFLMVKSGKSIDKIELRLQIALFLLFYRSFHPLPRLFGFT